MGTVEDHACVLNVGERVDLEDKRQSGLFRLKGERRESNRHMTRLSDVEYD